MKELVVEENLFGFDFVRLEQLAVGGATNHFKELRFQFSEIRRYGMNPERCSKWTRRLICEKLYQMLKVSKMVIDWRGCKEKGLFALADAVQLPVAGADVTAFSRRKSSISEMMRLIDNHDIR